MLEKFYIFILFLLFYQCGAVAEKNDCVARCSRLHIRSLDRIGFSEDKVHALFERLRPLVTMKDVCWREYDYLDCMKRCPKSREHEKYARNVRFKCKEAMRDMEDKLHCISKYHSFIEVKCSSFLNEAVRLRAKISPDTTPDRDTCRYLHLNSICLENSVSGYCPSAKKIFRRLNLRDYFLNFILPENDLEFDDDDLDNCQIYNFVRKAGNMNSEVYEEESEEGLTTLVNRWEAEETTTSSMGLESTEGGEKKATNERKDFTNLLTDLLSTSTSAEYLFSPTEVPLRPTTEEGLTRVTVAPVSVTTENTVESSTSDEADFFMETSTWSDEDQGTSRRPKGKGRKGKKKQNPIKLHDPTISTSTEIVETTTARTTSTMESSTETPESTTSSLETSTKSDEPTTIGLGTVVHIPVSVEVRDEVEAITPNSADISTEIVTKKKKVFSDDSMEDIPPNFYHSSMRSALFSSTTRYQLHNSDIVTPVSLDTSTLFGDEWAEPEVEQSAKRTTEMDRLLHLRPTGATDSVEQETQNLSTTTETAEIRNQDPSITLKKMNEVQTTVGSAEEESSTESQTTESMETTTSGTVEERKKNRKDKKKKKGQMSIVAIESRRTTTSRPDSQAAESLRTPMIRAGKVVVKPIIDWNQADDKEEVRDVMHRSIPKESEDPAHFRDQETREHGEVETTDTVTPTGNNISEAQLLIFIYILLFGFSLLALLCTLIFCVWCRKNTESYEINKY